MISSQKEIDRIRTLAERVATIARESRMADIKKRWADVNALRKPDRAPVWCRPVGCWKEIFTDNMLVCTKPELRRLEYGLLQILHKREIDDDTPVEDYVAIDAVFKRNPANTWGVDTNHFNPELQEGAWKYDPQLKSEADFERLRIPSFTYDAEATQKQMEQTADLLDGMMPVRLTAGLLLPATLGTAAADLRGLEQMMMDMVIEPGLLHRLMTYLRDVTLSAIDQVEATGLLTPNNIGPMTCSDRIGEIGEDNKVTCRNLWCMADSQEFDRVSPAMWEEFCLNYQKPIFKRFGLVAYGCCEDLTGKIDGVLSIPNLRIFTCSAWTNLTTVLEKTGRDYCIMWRQKASNVVFSKDGHQIKNDLMHGARQLQGFYYQIVLRELQTLAGNPNRLHEWTQYAKEAAERYS